MDDVRIKAQTTLGHGDEHTSITVVHEVGGYTTPDGFYHPNGVHRIKAFHTLSGRAYQGEVYRGRAKTFRGETAWSRAENLFDDIVREIQRGSRGF